MKKCVLVPTAVTEPHDCDLPNAPGRLRLKIAAEIAKKDFGIPIFIVGGYTETLPDGTRLSLAQKYAAWFAKEHPSLAQQVHVAGDQRTNNTVRDIIGAASEIREHLLTENELIEIHFCSHPKQCRQVKATLSQIGFVAVPEPSGEDPAYNSAVYGILTLITDLDPSWRGLVGRFFNAWSNMVSAQYVATCAGCRHARYPAPVIPPGD